MFMSGTFDVFHTDGQNRCAWADPGFPQEEAPKYEIAKLSQKLHEIENISGRATGV